MIIKAGDDWQFEIDNSRVKSIENDQADGSRHDRQSYRQRLDLLLETDTERGLLKKAVNHARAFWSDPQASGSRPAPVYLLLDVESEVFSHAYYVVFGGGDDYLIASTLGFMAGEKTKGANDDKQSR